MNLNGNINISGKNVEGLFFYNILGSFGITLFSYIHIIHIFGKWIGNFILAF